MPKNKYNYIICVFCTCLFLLFTSNVYASNDNEPIVDAYKVWAITFNQSIDFNKLTKESIQVKDKNNTLVDVKLQPGPCKGLVLVTPPEKGYNLGEEYALVITKQVYSEKNKQIKEEKTFNFKIKEISEKPIVFKDKFFENVVREKACKLGYQPIFKSDVENITELRLEYCEIIKDISGIENLVNLKSLDLTYSQVEDISELKGLKNLEELWLYDNKITDISALKDLTNLKNLQLYGNQITDIPSLRGLTNLEYIDLGNNKIHDITLLKELHNLKELNLVYNNITDVSSLKELTNLNSLNLDNNNITDISPLGKLSNLKKLSLSSNKTTDISPLKGLINLNSLVLDDNNITDISPLKGLTNLNYLVLGSNKITDISPLEGLTNLSMLRLKDTPINEAYKETLKKYLPNCDIKLYN
ncbi:leucine-rich repeat domain-containing protein [Clostridium thailandense]|uniref:leucine-rich repeat domain-containing protein n=1 Tax=Clostridium thailandense TaxID=2794346 RepID=UPI003989B147